MSPQVSYQDYTRLRLVEDPSVGGFTLSAIVGRSPCSTPRRVARVRRCELRPGDTMDDRDARKAAQCSATTKNHALWTLFLAVVVLGLSGCIRFSSEVEESTTIVPAPEGESSASSELALHLLEDGGVRPPDDDGLHAQASRFLNAILAHDLEAALREVHPTTHHVIETFLAERGAAIDTLATHFPPDGTWELRYPLNVQQMRDDDGAHMTSVGFHMTQHEGAHGAFEMEIVATATGDAWVTHFMHMPAIAEDAAMAPPPSADELLAQAGRFLDALLRVDADVAEREVHPHGRDWLRSNISDNEAALRDLARAFPASGSWVLRGDVTENPNRDSSGRPIVDYAFAVARGSSLAGHFEMQLTRDPYGEVWVSGYWHDNPLHDHGVPMVEALASGDLATVRALAAPSLRSVLPERDDDPEFARFHRELVQMVGDSGPWRLEFEGRLEVVDTADGTMERQEVAYTREGASGYVRLEFTGAPGEGRRIAAFYATPYPP